MYPVNASHPPTCGHYRRSEVSAPGPATALHSLFGSTIDLWCNTKALWSLLPVGTGEEGRSGRKEKEKEKDTYQ